MNKKFSTLVAALLVSGAGYAVVSSFDGLPMVSSPITEAATANLRALTPEQSGIVVANFLTEDITGTAINVASKWKYNSTLTALVTLDGNAYITADGKLSDDFSKAVPALNITAKSYVTIGGEYLVAENSEIKLITAANDDAAMAALSASQKLVKLYKATDGTVVATSGLASLGATACVLAEELIPSVSPALSVTVTPATAVKHFTMRALKTAVGAIGSDDKALTGFTVTTGKNSDKVLRLGTNQYVAVVGGALTLVESAADATEVTADDDFVCLGGNGNYVQIDAEGNVTVGVVGADATKQANRVIAFVENDATALTATTLPTATDPIFLVRQAGTAKDMLTVAAEVLCYDTKAPTTVSLGTAEFNTVYTTPASMTFAGAAAKTLTYADASSGFSYVLKYASDAATTEVKLVAESETGSTFKVAADGALLSTNGSFVARKAADGKLYLIALAAETGYEPIYAWTDAANAAPVLVSAAADIAAGDYMLSTSKAKAATNLAVGNAYVSYNQSATASGELRALTNGADYLISTAESENFLSMAEKIVAGKKVYSLANRADFDGEQVASVWTVEVKKNTNGVITHYSFWNKFTNQKLAFKIEPNDEGDGFNAPELDPIDGNYDQFFVDKEGRISFVADEKIKYEGNDVVDKTKYALDFAEATSDWSVKAYGASTDQFVVVEPDFIVVTAEGVAKQVEWLNVTAGSGANFEIRFKDKDGKAFVDVEENVLTSSPIVAVQGPEMDMLGATIKSETRPTLNNKLFLKVKGDYEYNNWSGADDDFKKAQLEEFRKSEFIIVDDKVYSDIIGDVDENDFYKFTTVKGSDLISATGYDAALIADKADLKADQDKTDATTRQFDGLTRRLENAVFTPKHSAGAAITDPVQLSVKARFLKSEFTGISQAGVNTEKTVYVAVKNFDDAYYVGAYNTPYTQVYVGVSNTIDYRTVNGIVNIYNYKTIGENKGKILGNVNNYNLNWLDAENVVATSPEGQFLVNYEKGKFTFTNRESGITKYSNPLKTVKDKEGNLVKDVYAVVGIYDTIQIVSAAPKTIYDGYQNYDVKKYELSDKVYNLSIKPTVEGLEEAIFYIKEAHATDHKLSMTTDSTDMAEFKLVKLEGAKDTVIVSVDKYITATGAMVQDSAVAFTYALYNADNKEFLTYNGANNKEFFYCNPDHKYTTDANAEYAPRFVLKQKGNGAYHLVAVDKGTDVIVFGAKENKRFYFRTYYYQSNGDTYSINDIRGKAYGASVANKLAEEGNIYKITDNDLINIQEVGAPMYRTIEAAPFDTIRIYKDGFDNTALYANSEKTALEDTTFHFLGMKHDSYVKKAQFSFFVDTAYVRGGTNKPQYLLVIDPDTIHGKDICSDPTHAPHDNGRIDTVYGKFLMNMVDSIPAWGNKHNNPYYWEKPNYPKLGFVDAKHIGDSLIIDRGNSKLQTAADTIDLKENTNKIGAYAFRIVDQATKSFVMETAYSRNNDGTYATGYIKWLNGVPVVITDIKEAEVFNLEATSNLPTDNENIETTEVSIIAGAGQVTINNAAGKTVVISNILGQTLVNTVLTSDNATISVPAGIVVVAVEGEEAVKAIVR